MQPGAVPAMELEMKRLIAEWIWRAAIIVALGWIGLELHQLRQDMMAPIDEQGAETIGPDPLDEQAEEQVASTST
jgi:hypothetical protein